MACGAGVVGGQEAGLLVVEVLVERPPRDTGQADDVGHRGGGVALARRRRRRRRRSAGRAARPAAPPAPTRMGAAGGSRSPGRPRRRRYRKQRCYDRKRSRFSRRRCLGCVQCSWVWSASSRSRCSRRRRPPSTSASRPSPASSSPGTPAQYNKVGILKIGPRSARNVLVLNPGTSAERGLLRAAGQEHRRQGPRLAGVVGRAAREPARGPVDARHAPRRARPRRSSSSTTTSATSRTRAISHHFQLDPRRERRVRQRVGDERRDRGPAPGRAAGAAQLGGKVVRRRPLARRLDHHRLRDLGLQRQAGRGRALRPRLHRRRQRARCRSRPTEATQSLAAARRRARRG